MDLQLRGKRAFISGSTQGIGYAIAAGLLREGATVILNGRTRDRVDAAVERLRAEVPGGAISGLAADFGDPSGAPAAGLAGASVDILVNNVGLFDLRAFEEISDEEWQHYVEVNLMSGVRLSRHAAPRHARRGLGPDPLHRHASPR